MNAEEDDFIPVQNRVFEFLNSGNQEICDISLLVNHSDNDKTHELSNAIQEDDLTSLNRKLDGDNPRETLSALKSLENRVGSVNESVAPLYHTEMAFIKEDKQESLSLEEVRGGVTLINALARVNLAIEGNDPTRLLSCLSDPQVGLTEVISGNAADYLRHLRRERQLLQGTPCPFLRYVDVHSSIISVNLKKEQLSKDLIQWLNEALEAQQMNEALQAFTELEGDELSKNNSKEVYNKLKMYRHQKGTDLSLEDIPKIKSTIFSHSPIASRMDLSLKQLNISLLNEDHVTTHNLLRELTSSGEPIPNSLYQHIVEDLVELLLQKNNRGNTHSVHEQQQDFHMQSGFLCFDDIQTIVQKHIQLNLERKKMESLILFQAHCRGYLTRKILYRKIRSAIVIQKWWRHLRKTSKKEVTYPILINEPQTVQQACHKSKHNDKMANLLVEMRNQEKKIVVIQKAWRRYRAKQDLQILINCENPSLNLIQKYIHLLRVSPKDFETELKIQNLKTDIVKSIKNCHEKEKQLDDLDIKIGLLVQNKMASQSTSQNKENAQPQSSKCDKKSEKHKKDLKQTLSCPQGLKALTKEARDRLSGYQHLFYLLQTEPRYLSDLIVAQSPGKSLKFLDRFIFNLFNFGANDRDHFFLLKLLKMALEKEIRNKILRLNDVYTADPQVLKMVVGYIRQGPGHVSLRQVLAPLVEMVVCDKDLQINTNPVEIYRGWVNHMETVTGKPSELPHNVSSEDALKHPEVRNRLSSVINSLKTASKEFCDQITRSDVLLPYSIQYMTKILGATLVNRFPHLPEKEILKVMGYLIYYRYINSAIVAPDAFDVISVTPETKLTSLQRRNLASIAKILQFAATKKGFGTEASHLMCLNPFIIELHEKFREFFLRCTRVDEPEVIYNVDEYSEETLTIKPTVYMSLQDIVDIHKMIKSNLAFIAPEASDPLHALLADLDQNPSLACLVGNLPDQRAYLEMIGRTEICLSLSMKPISSPKIPTQKSTKDAGQKLFNRTKQLLIDLLQCVDCENMNSLINKPSDPSDESRYKDLIESRTLQERAATLNETELNRGNSFLGEARVSLHEVKTRLSHNLRKLENSGLTFKSNGYQSLLNAVAKEIINQRHHRSSRRSEQIKLYTTWNQLQAKVKFYTDQLQSYREYHDMCLINVTGKKRNIHANGGRKWKKKQKVLSYTGSKLSEKKILVEIEDLPAHQLKHVLFIISPESTPGVFEITVKFMGVPMETMTLDIEELLSLQFEGVAVHSLKNRARVNVNLLLHLLNDKFYSVGK